MSYSMGQVWATLMEMMSTSDTDVSAEDVIYDAGRTMLMLPVDGDMEKKTSVLILLKDLVKFKSNLKIQEQDIKGQVEDAVDAIIAIFQATIGPDATFVLSSSFELQLRAELETIKNACT